MDQIALKVSNLSIIYRELHRISLKTLKKREDREKTGFTALKDISFSANQGEVIGIIGKNGSGKSTLLRAIAGIFSADKGTIETFGNTISLLAIGVGFQNNLSGRENIYLSGLLLGFTEEEINQKIEEIIEFSELGDFIDKPVKTYSSGMYSKLAFSITAVLETDIMLIDEVLSVGDAGFKEKSYNRIKDLISDEKRTVLIVSHNMNTIKTLCDRVLWLHDGQVRGFGTVKEVIPAYEKIFVKGKK